MNLDLTWFLIISFLLLSLILGVVASRGKAEHLDDYLVAGRNIKTMWGFATLSATEMGLVTVIYFSQESYANGFVALITAFIASLTMWFIGKTGFVIKKLRTLEIRTVPEYFDLRYSSGIRFLGGILTFLTGVLNLGIFLQVEGRFLCVILGLPPENLPLIMGVLLVFVIVYTSLGGMFSVIVTDIFQFVVMIFGISVASYYAFSYAGGIHGMIETVNSHFGESGFNLIKAPKYGLIFIIWTALYYISGWSSWQPVVQRTLSIKSVDTALKLFRVTSLFMLLRAGIPMLWGIAAIAILGPGKNTQTALPEMLLMVVPAWMIGIIVIGFLAASMSTYDSYLLSFSSIMVQDIVGPVIKKNLSDKSRIYYTRIGIIVIGIFVFLWGIYFTFTDTVFRLIALTGSLSYAGIISSLAGGIYWKKANTTGAYAAFVLSAIPPVYSLFINTVDPMHAGLMSFILAPFGILAGSLFGRGKKSKYQPGTAVETV